MDNNPGGQRWYRTLTSEAGVALVLTLIIVTLVAIIVLDLNYLMRVDVHASANFRDGVRAYYLAKSGVNVVKELFRRNNQELEEIKNALLTGEPQTLPIGEDSASVRVMDETGKINVNALVVQATPPQASAGAQTPQRAGRAQPLAAQLESPWIQITQDLLQRLGINRHSSTWPAEPLRFRWIQRRRRRGCSAPSEDLPFSGMPVR